MTNYKTPPGKCAVGCLMDLYESPPKSDAPPAPANWLEYLYQDIRSEGEDPDTDIVGADVPLADLAAVPYDRSPPDFSVWTTGRVYYCRGGDEYGEWIESRPRHPPRSEG